MRRLCQKAKEDEHEPKEELSWTADHCPIALDDCNLCRVLALSPFTFPLDQLVLLLYEFQRFLSLLLFQLFEFAEDLPLKVFWCCLLHVHLALRQSSQSFLPFAQMLHFHPKSQAAPLQLCQALQLFISSHLASDEDLVRSVSEDLKQLTSRLPRFAHHFFARFVWRQDLFLQFSRADLHDLAVLDIL